MPDGAVVQTRLAAVLAEIGPAVIAVSGGVDSMTLAVAGHRLRPDDLAMAHAVSPAVPPQATARVVAHAGREGWRLHMVDAGEFADPAYLANPVDRCFHCKTNLYRIIVAAHAGRTVLSGTNHDDLGDYRPGLQAAAEHGVRHPFVEAAIDKAGVRALARHLGLDDLAELPAAPCLSSRVETGLPVVPAQLTLVNDVEQYLSERLRPRTVRCRIRAAGVVVELDEGALANLDTPDRERLCADVSARCAAAGLDDRPVSLEPYRMGSAFLKDEADV